MKLRSDLFFKELLLFGATLAIGVFSAYQYSISAFSIPTQEIRFQWSDLIFVLVVILFMILTSKYKKLAAISYRLFLVLIVFSGSQSVFGSIWPGYTSLLATLLITLSFSLIRNVLFHNVGIILGIAGVASILGLSVSPKTAVIAMVAMSFYDIIAVYFTKHMIRMAKDMMDAGATFGFIIPSEIKGFLFHEKDARAQMGSQFMVLGSGDIGLPLILASSIVRYSLFSAIIVAVFSLAGLFLTHIIFVNQKERKAMAALPPIATMSIIGYLLATLL